MLPGIADAPLMRLSVLFGEKRAIFVDVLGYVSEGLHLVDVASHLVSAAVDH